jgi:hypothetical protein
MPYRIAAYDAQGRLSSFMPVGPEHVARKHDVDEARSEAAAQLQAEGTKLRNWISWIIGVDDDGNFIPPDEQDMENSAVNAFNQLAEIAHALNHDPNAFHTLMSAINATNDVVYSLLADFTNHKFAQPLAHPDGSVIILGGMAYNR